MRMFDAEAVHRLLPYPALIDALRQAHLETVDQAEAHLLTQPRAAPAAPGKANAPAMSEDVGNAFLVLPAWRHDRTLSVKVVTVFPQNPNAAPPRPAVQAVVLLFDGADGAPLACIDGAALTYRKTAADSALGAAFLARADSRSLLMVGAGGLAPHVIRAHLAARPGVTEVRIWNRTPDRAETVAAALSREGLSVTATRDLETAARQADVISCATNATEPLIRGAWLKPGAHLDLIGSYTPDMRETDDEALTRGAIYGDLRRRVLADSGEIAQALASGAISEADILGDLYDLARGRCEARRSPEQITIFKNAGGGHLDLMTAEFLIRADRATTAHRLDPRA